MGTSEVVLKLWSESPYENETNFIGLLSQREQRWIMIAWYSVDSVNVILPSYFIIYTQKSPSTKIWVRRKLYHRQNVKQ
ncbi:hypothetical protein JTB14_027858 [Gonioctena quinquepunctata]|nr:hypothetical protein JTB14_027858 [Gonioctena quinquepunctata]